MKRKTRTAFYTDYPSNSIFAYSFEQNQIKFQFLFFFTTCFDTLLPIHKKQNKVS